MTNVGICLLMTQHDFDIVGLARKVEELGFGSLWAPEHGVVPADFSVGASGGRVGRSQRVCRRPHQSDHRPAGVSGSGSGGHEIGAPRHGHLSGAGAQPNPAWPRRSRRWISYPAGGSYFGIGAGWLQGEAEVLGADFPRRWRQTKEYVNAMKELWTNPVSEFPRQVGGLSAHHLRPQAGAKTAPASDDRRRADASGAAGGGLRRRLAAPGTHHLGVP